MVLLIPANANPTMADIDTYLLRIGRIPESLRDIEHVIREIQCKSGAGALLHPAEEYFVRQSLFLSFRA
jgi:hypothetical protein